MKHLRRFNEELEPRTYRSAAQKIKKMVSENPRLAKAKYGSSEEAGKQASELETHASQVEMTSQLARWERRVKEMSKYGEFQLTLSSGDENEFTGLFYLDISPNLEDLVEFWDEYNSDNRNIDLSLAVGLIPKNKEDIKVIMDIFDADFYNSFFWGFWITIKYEVKDGSVGFNGLGVDDYDSDTYNVIINRNSAIKLKRYLVNLFDKNGGDWGSQDYPSSYTDITDFYEKVEIEIIQGLEIYSDYGIDMERIKSDLQKLPVLNLMQE